MFFRDVIAALTASKISYCVVGGLAVNLHGVPRMTYDVDLVVAMDQAALAEVGALLERLGLRSRLPLRLADFADPEYRNRMRDERNLIAVTYTDPSDPLREVDVLVAPPIDPAALLDRAVSVDLDGVTVKIVALSDLIRLKRASPRPQDADDAALLERIRDEEEHG